MGQQKGVAMFEERHYEQIAEVIGKLEYAKTIDVFGGVMTIREHLIESFINLFEADNPRFTSDRFVEAVYKSEGRETSEFDCPYCGKEHGH